MWIRHLRNGIRGNVTKLTDAMIVVKSLPAFTGKYNIQRRECIASIRVVLLCIAFVKHRTDDSDKGIGRDSWTRLWLIQHLLQPTGNPGPTG